MEITKEDLEKLIDERARKLISDSHERPTSPPATPPASSTEPKSGDSQPHTFVSYRKTCVGCDAKNPNYKAPDVWCSDCGQPLGNLPAEFVLPKPGETKEVPGINDCPSCGSTVVTAKKGA